MHGRSYNVYERLDYTSRMAGEYQNAIATLRNQARRTRQDDMAVAASPAGGPDTITQGAS